MDFFTRFFIEPIQKPNEEQSIIYDTDNESEKKDEDEKDEALTVSNEEKDVKDEESVKDLQNIDGIEKILDRDNSYILDVSSMLKMSKFKIKPDRLIERCKYILKNKVGLNDDSDLADNFQFIFPVVGPLSKKEYLSTLKKFNLEKMFPNINKGIYYNFYVDPYEHNRVWFTARMRCCHTGSNTFGAATNIDVDCPPQVNSLTFNEDGKVTKYTGGYITDRTIGNTGGLGGIFGILYAIGRPLPFPEARPYRKSWQFRTFSFFGM